MSTLRIRALAFDIGQVIVPVCHQRTKLALARITGLALDDLTRMLSNPEHSKAFQEGRLAPKAWYESIKIKLGVPLTFVQFCEAWNFALGQDTLLPNSLFAELLSRYYLILLSNTDPIHSRYLEMHYEFPKYFHSRLYSHNEGLSKPDPAIYQRVLDCAGVIPEELFYTDDVPEFVEAGRRFGMHTHLFRGADGLLAELRALNISFG